MRKRSKNGMKHFEGRAIMPMPMKRKSWINRRSITGGRATGPPQTKKHHSPVHYDDKQPSDKNRARAYVDNGSGSPRKHVKPKKSKMNNDVIKNRQEKSITKTVSSELDDDDNGENNMVNYQNAKVVYGTSNANPNRNTNDLVCSNEDDREAAKIMTEMGGPQ